MKHSFLDLLSSSLIPELCSDISTGTSRHIHFILIGVATIWTFPDQLSIVVGHDLDLPVIATLLTVITLCIELCVHNMLHHT